MTVPTPIQQRIRILDARGVSWRRISKEVGVSRQTVRKYAQLEDCSPEPPARPAAVSKLDPYKPLIGKWLEADRFMPRKQRHTARRVYDRLVEERGFDGSYQIVQRYVKRWRQEHRLPGDGYLELEWSPGVMQADFGLAQAVVAGSRTDVHCLVASFPHSNMRYAVALPGENAECVCEGLLEVFEHIGAVPPVLVLDNATGAAHRVHRGGDHVAHREHFGRVTDELIADLRDMYESVLMHADIHERAEIDDVAHRSLELHARFEVLDLQNVRAQDGRGEFVAGIAPRF